MKKRIIIFIAIITCSLGMAINVRSEAFAENGKCTVGDTAKECLEKLKAGDDWKAIKGTCDNSESGCIATIVDHIPSCGSISDKDACKSHKKSKAKQVRKIMYSNNSSGDKDSSKTDSKTDDSSSTEDAAPVELEPVEEGACTSILPKEWCSNKDSSGMQSVINLVLAILTGGVVVAGTVGLIICGVMWMTARDNENQVATAKRRMMEIVIGIIAWVLIYALANLFIPKSSQDLEKGSIQVDSSEEESSS